MGTVTIVKASAGSGKTYRLAYEYVRRVVADPDLYRSILAVTFTNKATEEMKRRITAEINDLANGRTAAGKEPSFLSELSRDLEFSSEEIAARAKRVRTKILHDYSRFTVLTIDKFFQRIIRAFLRELDIESDFSLELNTDSVLADAADRLIEATASDPDLRKWIAGFIEEQIDEGRRWDVRGDIISLGRQLFSEGEHATGDTSGHERKAALSSILKEALSTVNAVKATMTVLAQDAVAKIESAGLSVADFSYAKSGVAGYLYRIAAGEIEEGYGVRVKEALASDEKWTSKTSPRKAEIQSLAAILRPILSEITGLYDQNSRFFRTAGLVRENYRTYAVLSDLARSVREICTDCNLMLITDTNRLLAHLVEGNDAPFLFEKVGNAYSHFLMDEFQDTSATQWHNFQPLLANALSQSEESPVLIVGDVKQSIYRWRGGDWRILGAEAAARFGGALTVSLDRNWRSDGVVVAFNNAMIRGVVALDNNRLNDELLEARERGLLPATLCNELTDTLKRAYEGSDQQVGRPERLAEGYVEVIQYEKAPVPDATDEAAAAAAGGGEAGRRTVALVESLQQRGFRLQDIAILVRRNSEGKAIADALLEHKSVHPESPWRYDVVSQDSLFISASPAVNFVLACFRLAVDPADAISAALFRRTLFRTVDSVLPENDKRFFRSLALLSLEEAFERVMLTHRLGDRPGEVAYLQAFHDQLIAFAGNRIADLPLFLRWWDETGVRESINLPGGQDAITVITIHKAKGLQYPVVILPYADWGLNPAPRKTLLWSETDQAPFDRLGRVPVNYKTAAAESHFSPAYYTEKVFSHVDNINTLYVALTRAERECYVLLPQAKRRTGTTVADLMLDCFEPQGDAVCLDDLDGRIAGDPAQPVYAFGRPTQPAATPAAVAEPETGYPTFDFTGKIRLRNATERYFSDDPDQLLSPRSYGRLMHSVFEHITSLEELPATLDRLVLDGALSEKERVSVAEKIEKSLENPLVRSWFSDAWTVVRNESEILLPPVENAGRTRRPDRVLIDGKRVVVIDYKFGVREQPAYRLQVAEYVDLIRRMGFSDVEGFLWYVETGKVEQV